MNYDFCLYSIISFASSVRLHMPVTGKTWIEFHQFRLQSVRVLSTLFASSHCCRLGVKSTVNEHQGQWGVWNWKQRVCNVRNNTPFCFCLSRTRLFQASTLVTRVTEVIGSSFFRSPSCADLGFSWFLVVPLEECRKIHFLHNSPIAPYVTSSHSSRRYLLVVDTA